MFSRCETYRLYERGGAGVCCDVDGVALGPVKLVERVDKSYFVRPVEDITLALEVAYGALSKAAAEDLALKIVGIARSLNAGELVLAKFKALYLRLPEIPCERLAKMHSVVKAGYNPDQPRDDHGRWSGDGASGVNIGSASADGSIVQVQLNGFGDTYLDRGFASKVKEFDKTAREAGVTLHFTSAYRTPERQKEIRDKGLGITPAELSLHSAGLAVDVKYSRFPPNEQKIIRDAAEKAGLKWGGNFRHPKEDPVHFYLDPGGNRQQRIQNFNHKVSRLRN